MCLLWLHTSRRNGSGNAVPAALDPASLTDAFDCPCNSGLQIFRTGYVFNRRRSWYNLKTNSPVGLDRRLLDQGTDPGFLILPGKNPVQDFTNVTIVGDALSNWNIILQSSWVWDTNLGDMGPIQLVSLLYAKRSKSSLCLKLRSFRPFCITSQRTQKNEGRCRVINTLA
jgi:hypothetical protein